MMHDNPLVAKFLFDIYQYCDSGSLTKEYKVENTMNFYESR